MTRPQLHALRWATAATVAAMAGILAAELLAGALAASAGVLAGGDVDACKRIDQMHRLRRPWAKP